MRSSRTTIMTGIGLASLLLAGCHKKPEGQVVATVNGSEVTRRDLVAELGASGGRSVDDLKTMQSSLLQGVVDRKLLIQEAKRENLDKNPQYLAQLQRTQDILLAQMLAQTLTGRAKPPTPAEAQAYVAEHPLMFGGRRLLTVDEIDTAAASIDDATLATLTDNDAVAGWLKTHNRPFSRGPKTVDTFLLPPELATRMIAGVGAKPFRLRNAGVLGIAQVQQVKDAPIPAGQQVVLAQRALQRQRASQTLNQELNQLRASADIKYLAGFSPPSGAGEKPL